ncbi:MAG: ATP-dependent DNA helicase [Dermabacter sp.]|nr:ATP-dependent DNA helicase [Dermabacter sp.]
MLRRAVGAVGGQEREGQRRMAEAIEASVASGRHLLVQAGTGTGKSLAYLVPALMHAVATNTTVVIATATIALQHQIVSKDLPRLVDALGPHLGRTPSFGLLKGRGNYVCLHKLDGGYPDDLDPGSLFSEASVTGAPGDSERLGEQVRRLREWARVSDTGDRDSLPVPVSDRAWRQVSVSSGQCLASACPVKDACFAERNRSLAREVDVVVTNHALLAIDAFDKLGIVPPHDLVIIDEAHDLVDRVTAAATETLSHGSVRGAVRELRALGVAAAALDDAGSAFADALAAQSAGRIIGDLEPRLKDTLTHLEIEARGAFSDAKDAGERSDAATAGARKSVRTRLQEIMDVCERLVAPDDDDVRFVSHSEATGRTMIDVAPLSVAAMMRAALLRDTTVVFTSATLAFAERFEPAAAQFGLWKDNRVDVADPVPGVLSHAENADRDQWAGIDVGSPFDYPKQGILYTARHLPPPGRDGLAPATLEHLTELIEAAGGGALGLFSSRRAAEDAAAHVRAHTGRTVLLQGEDSLSALVQRFRESEDSCLFGSRALWQGVDVPGHACRLVLIDRIPFPRPDDPLASARQERVEQRGGNGFMAVSASHAALLMAQGAGRLIRAVEDRGMVVVLDQRLATKRYGSYLREAMPRLWPTSSPDVALAALARLRAAAR